MIIIGGGDTGRRLPGHLAPAEGGFGASVRDHADASGGSFPLTPWPLWPLQLRMESSHEEGGKREWAVATTHFSGDDHGNVEKLHGIRVGPPPKFEAIPGTEFTLDADLVLLAMGFTGPVKRGLIEQPGGADSRGNSPPRHYQTSMPGVFAAGDARRGQSLVVWAIAEGRKAAEAVDVFLRA